MVIQIKVSEKVYLKDPESSKLGKKIITGSVTLIDELGLEQFNFKKLAEEIGSTEASIYRYFENKHNLLIYLISWYWSWIEYQVLFSTNNIKSAMEKIEISFSVLSQPVKFDPTFLHINEEALYRVVISESAKAYLTKEVDADNKEGYFATYKRLCNLIAGFVIEINSEYPYPNALVSTMMEATHNQRFFAQHLPRLTEIQKGNEAEVKIFLVDLIKRALT